MALVQLIYVSASRKLLDDQALDEILEASVRRNDENEITGMLLYAAGNFMQVLEGPEDAVDETFQRISQDQRHFEVMLVTRDIVDDRQFSRWSMGFRRLAEADAKAHPAYAELILSGFDASHIGAKPGIALDLLLNFSLSNT